MSDITKSTRGQTYTLSVFLILAGTVLVLVGSIDGLRQTVRGDYLRLFGVALFVSATVDLLQRRFAAEAFHRQVREDLKIIVEASLQSSFDLVKTLKTDPRIHNLLPTKNGLDNGGHFPHPAGCRGRCPT